MPTQLETLVKILKLERQQGGRDAAVEGGLSAYCKIWEPKARQQARRPAHQILIDEIVDSLADYGRIESEDDRLHKVGYLLERIMNRRPPPQTYQARLADWEAKMTPRPSQSPPAARPNRPDKRRPSSSTFIEEHGAWDKDYAAGPEDHRLDVKPLPRLSRPPRAPRRQRGPDEERALQEDLAQPTTALKGIGGQLADLLKAMDLHTVRDLLWNFPRDYKDYTELKCIKDLSPNSIETVIATVRRAHVAVGKNRRKDLLIEVEDGSGRLSVRFFGQHFLRPQLRPGKQIVMSGKVAIYRNMLQMANPEWEYLDVENLHTTGIVPIYRMTKGLRPRLFRRVMKALADDWASKLPDPVPRTVLERCELADLGWAVQQSHFPEGWDHLHHARRRITFDKQLMFQLAMLGKRREWQSVAGQALAVEDDFLESFIDEAFPFELTGAQWRVIAEIRRDVAQMIPMNRLIQGDVGSGKTAVAAVAMAMALANGKQAALMAPTSILAEQHYRGLSETFGKMKADQPPVIALLTSSLTTPERESIYRGLADGSIDIAVGTHALIQEGVHFHDLGLAVIDEQQRFGVDQRGHLRGKGHHPHLLVMTATPIPRTLALTVHADLDLSIIDEKPPGRQAVQTKIIEQAARERLNGFVIAQLEQGRQAFFVHPLIEESESIETASAVEAHERLSQVFFRYRVCLLHGQMNSSEKDRIMADFARGDYDVMAATSVAEVGVDVPNASVMVIDGANRFGLAQLHQFRGRVGRGEHPSFCFLLPDSADISIDKIQAHQEGRLPIEDLSIAERRLAAMEASNDGFYLAEVDWKLRGSGDLLGQQQSGKSNEKPSLFDMLEATSPELIEELLTDKMSPELMERISILIKKRLSESSKLIPDLIDEMLLESSLESLEQMYVLVDEMLPELTDEMSPELIERIMNMIGRMSPDLVKRMPPELIEQKSPKLIEEMIRELIEESPPELEFIEMMYEVYPAYPDPKSIEQILIKAMSQDLIQAMSIKMLPELIEQKSPELIETLLAMLSSDVIERMWRESDGERTPDYDYVPLELVELALREAHTLYEEDPELKLPAHRLLAQRIASRSADIS